MLRALLDREIPQANEIYQHLPAAASKVSLFAASWGETPLTTAVCENDPQQGGAAP